MVGLTESMSQYQGSVATMEANQPLSPQVDLQRRRVANQLARQQEEYEESLLGTFGETPRYLVRLRAAQQAAQNAISATRDDLEPQNFCCSRIGVAVALAFRTISQIAIRLNGL